MCGPGSLGTSASAPQVGGGVTGPSSELDSASSALDVMLAESSLGLLLVSPTVVVAVVVVVLPLTLPAVLLGSSVLESSATSSAAGAAHALASRNRIAQRDIASVEVQRPCRPRHTSSHACA